MNLFFGQQKVFFVAFHQIYRIAPRLVTYNAALDGVLAGAKVGKLITAFGVGEHTLVWILAAPALRPQWVARCGRRARFP